MCHMHCVYMRHMPLVYSTYSTYSLIQPPGRVRPPGTAAAGCELRRCLRSACSPWDRDRTLPGG